MEDTIIYKGIRDDRFRTLIKNVLIKGNLKEKYIDLLLDDESMKIYDQAFTSSTYDPIKNYEFYEQLGDSSIGQFIIWYAYRRFPNLKTTEGVKTVARIKINYGSRNILSKIADELGFAEYISVSQEFLLQAKKDILEDVFEAFIGATISILDDKIRIGVGYAIVYDILKAIYDNIYIPTNFEELIDAKTRLKELFDTYKNKIGIQPIYETIKNTDKRGYNTKVYMIKDKQKVLLAQGFAARIQDSEQNAASEAIRILRETYNIYKNM